ncbi:phenylalanine--tRNA ligase subunit beta [soil metagenome]
MRVPVSWLREFVDVPAESTPEDLLAALVKVGFEEEEIHRSELTGPIVVGRVVSLEPEPQSNGKTINWCQVDVGESEPRGIVCGAHNFAAGDLVVVTLPGAVLPGPFPIAARKTYGHVSDGMIASARELGLGDEHSGILRLEELGIDATPGADAIPLLGLDDWAVEINVTPDRGYAFSIRGVAREYAHSTGVEFHDPADAVTPVRGEGFEVSIADSAPIRGRLGVVGFVTRVVRGVDATRPTPDWMATRLRLAGLRSISLLVDITNYVMLELGQPIHGYDFDKISGGFVVRRAAKGETFVTLDGQKRSLDPEDLLIADDSGPVGLAGVMGGASTEISDSTTTVLVEAATWEPVTIARTARRHKLLSEAAKRYERGVDPAVGEAGAARVVQLMVELAGGTADALGSFWSIAEAPSSIELPAGYVNAITGADYSDDESVRSLTEIGCTVETTDAGWLVTPPSWRPDLTDKATLVEEVARVVGYDRIPAVLPTAPPGRGLTRAQRLRRAAANVLAANGLVEVLAYPFLSAAQNASFGSAEGSVPAIRLLNPLDAEAAQLRTSLLPGLIATAHRNLSRGLVDVAIFELGSTFRPAAGVTYGSGPLPSGVLRPSDGELSELLGSIPPQPLTLAALLLGDAVAKQPGQAARRVGLVDAFDVVRQLATAVGAVVDFRQGSHQAFHPGRTAELFAGQRSIGFAGQLLPSLAEELDLPRTVAVVELDLGALIESARPDVLPRPLSGFPAATQDLSLVVPVEVPAGDLLSTVVEGAGDLLEDARLVDDYRGSGLAEGTKSVTLALRFRASERTLTASEASAAKLAGAALAAERHGATIRE